MGGGSSKNTAPVAPGQVVGMRGGGGEPLTLGTAANSMARDWDSEFQEALSVIDNGDHLKGSVHLEPMSSLV